MAGALALFFATSAPCAAPDATYENIGGRPAIVYVPSRLPAPGARALVIVLHGGLGNAQIIEAGKAAHGLNMDAVAERGGFVVAYLNGTPATRVFAPDRLAWNAGGGCCGQSYLNNIDDVGYISGAIEHLADEYGIDRNRIYGMGHSNGAMMTQRMMCETTLFAAAVAIAGPLNDSDSSCPSARGRRILAIHGADDANVPIAGGPGSQGLSRTSYTSEDHSRQIFVDSGATYELQVVTGADHRLDSIGAVIRQSEGQTVAEKAARYFGLLGAAQ